MKSSIVDTLAGDKLSRPPTTIVSNASRRRLAEAADLKARIALERAADEGAGPRRPRLEDEHAQPL
jgi:hypothetical protein